MRLNWKIYVIVISMIMVYCARPKTVWEKWHESLDLASPNDIQYKADLQKKNFYEGEPLVFKMLICSKREYSKTIVPKCDRISNIAGGLQIFKIITELDSVLVYFPNMLVDFMMDTSDAIVLKPYDTLYLNTILSPDIFRQQDFPMEPRNLLPGEYILESKINLGTKFYPRPGRGLFITTNPTIFTVESLSVKEQYCLSKIRPYMKSFFSCVEECLIPPDRHGDQEMFIDSALFRLDQIRSTNSYFSPYADFIYTCIPAIERTHNDTINLNKSISEAKNYIGKYDGSILSEEMEFKLVWWLYHKDSTATVFLEYAKKVIKKYPRNLISFSVKKHIPNGK